jgi:hypothetical protein
VAGFAASVRGALAHAAKPRYFLTDGQRKTPAIDPAAASLRAARSIPRLLPSWITAPLRFRNAGRASRKKSPHIVYKVGRIC